MSKPIIYPKPLAPGDRIAIISPASIVAPQYVHQSVDVLSHQGWIPYLGKCTLSRHGSFSGPLHDRARDFIDAYSDSSTRAILCSRGGYGCVQLLDLIKEIDTSTDPKWIIGFSDVSALHAFMQSRGIASIHASMTKHISLLGESDSNNQSLFAILQGHKPSHSWLPHPLNHLGHTTGRIVGGNLSVLQALINTPYDLLMPDIILFIEDIAEPVYKVERMLYQLRLNGVLDSLRGLIIGQFTDYRPDINHDNMEAMISKIVGQYDYPISFNSPIGHVDNNIPIIEGATATLTTTPIATHLSFL